MHGSLPVNATPVMPLTTIYRSDHYSDRKLRGAPPHWWHDSPFACAALSGQAPTPAGAHRLRCAGLTANARAKRQSSCATMRPRPTARLRTATAMLYSARVAEPEAPLRPLDPRSPRKYRDPKPAKVRAPAQSSGPAMTATPKCGLAPFAEPNWRSHGTPVALTCASALQSCDTVL
jgi:hypothetical protein